LYLVAEVTNRPGRSRGAFCVGKTALIPVNVSDEMQEIEVRWYAFSLAPRREHVVRKVEFIVFPAVVLAEESLNRAPRSLDGVRVGPGVRIDELDAVIDGAMRVTESIEISVRSPRIADDRSAGFDPVTYDGHQCVSGSVRNGDKECLAGLAFHTTKHPLTINRVSSMILAPTELALINLDGCVMTADFDGAAL